MNKIRFPCCLELLCMIILIVKSTAASHLSIQTNSVPINESKDKEKADELQQRSDEIVLLDEHLKTNNLLQKHLASNERLLNKQLNINLKNPELNVNRELKSELFSDKDHPSILSFSHLISPHLKDDDFHIERPVLGPELAQKYQRELHETLKAHQHNLHQALKDKHSHLNHAMNKYHNQNLENFNLNKFGEHSSVSSGPNEESLYQNDHISHNHGNSRPQNDNSYISPQSNPVSSLNEGGPGYQDAYVPVKHNDYVRPGYNNGHSHNDAYSKNEEPHHVVKNHLQPSKEYYYENQKVQHPVSHTSPQTGYSGKDVNNENGFNSEYPPNAYSNNKEFYPSDKMVLNQYNQNPDLQNNKNSYTAPQQHQTNNNHHAQLSHSSGGNINKNYPYAYNYESQEVSLQNNRKNPELQNLIPHHGHPIPNQHSYTGNAEISNTKYGNAGDSYGHENGGPAPAYNNRPYTNHNQNPTIKKVNPQIYSSINGQNANGKNKINSYSLNPNSLPNTNYNQNNHGTSEGIKNNFNQRQHQHVYTQGQPHSNFNNNNKMYANGQVQNGYTRNLQVPNRKRYNAPAYQGKNVPDNGNYNNGSPQIPGMNHYNGKNNNNPAPFVPNNKSPYNSGNPPYLNSNNRNLPNARQYSTANQNPGYQNYPNNLNANTGSANVSKNHPNSAGNINNRSGYEKNSYLYRKENPLKIVTTSSPIMKTPNALSALNAPIIHQIYMSEPLFKPHDMFLGGMI